ncbi:MAG: TIGR00159 family protein [Acidobacteria bacterium]|nr:TIGR00159 family protein [Acidobacteriota bacterium]
MELLHEMLASTAGRLTPAAVLDIVLTAFLLYQLMLMIKGRRAAHALAGISVLTGLYLFARAANLELLRTLLATLAPYTAFGLIVMFQSEIRRLLARLGRHDWVGFTSRLKRREFVEEILLAVEQLSRTHTGALIVLERDMGLRTFVESGVHIDAVVSRDLLLSIFENKGALHDGAVIVQNERLAAAACFLPLTTNPVMSKAGTRHRAAMGGTEDSDCLAIIVSEETGRISAAGYGHLRKGLNLQQLDELISSHLNNQTDETSFNQGAARVAVSATPTPDSVNS